MSIDPSNPIYRRVSLMRLIAAASLTAAFAGCAQAPKASQIVSVPMHAPFAWQHADWSITLKLLPYKKSPEGCSVPASSYHIVRGEKAITVGSAFHDQIPSFTNFHSDEEAIKAKVRIFASADGKTLLIQESIPNDCSPCDNYLLIKDTGTQLSFTWLEIPSDPSADPNEPCPSNARILAVTADSLWFDYYDHKSRQSKFDELKKLDRPTPPG